MANESGRRGGTRGSAHVRSCRRIQAPTACDAKHHRTVPKPGVGRKRFMFRPIAALGVSLCVYGLTFSVPWAFSYTPSFRALVGFLERGGTTLNGKYRIDPKACCLETDDNNLTYVVARLVGDTDTVFVAANVVKTGAAWEVLSVRYESVKPTRRYCLWTSAVPRVGE